MKTWSEATLEEINIQETAHNGIYTDGFDHFWTGDDGKLRATAGKQS